MKLCATSVFSVSSVVDYRVHNNNHRETENTESCTEKLKLDKLTQRFMASRLVPSGRKEEPASQFQDP